MNDKKGQTILAVIMWGVGISASMLAGGYALISGKFTNVNTDIKTNAVNIAVVQQKTDDIDQRLTRMEAKLDLIIERVKR